MKYIFNSLWILVFFLIYVIVVNSLLSAPQVNLPVKSYIVKSGSMEPTIMTGDVALIATRPYNIQVGDIITYLDPKDRTVTHRITKIINASGTWQIFTKGDNNQVTDPYVITPDRVQGKWLYTVPKLGFLVVKISQPPIAASFAFLIICLALLPEFFKEKAVAKA